MVLIDPASSSTSVGDRDGWWSNEDGDLRTPLTARRAGTGAAAASIPAAAASQTAITMAGGTVPSGVVAKRSPLALRTASLEAVDDDHHDEGPETSVAQQHCNQKEEEDKNACAVAITSPTPAGGCAPESARPNATERAPPPRAGRSMHAGRLKSSVPSPSIPKCSSTRAAHVALVVGSGAPAAQLPTTTFGVRQRNGTFSKAPRGFYPSPVRPRAGPPTFQRDPARIADAGSLKCARIMAPDNPASRPKLPQPPLQ